MSGFPLKLSLLALVAGLPFQAKAEAVWEKDLAACDIAWEAPSRDSFDSMPLPGARGAGANVWVQDGSVWLYLAHNGAYDEAGRLLKLGCLRLTPTGADCRQPSGFTQTQDLAQGKIRIAMTAADGTRLGLTLRFSGETLLIDSASSRELAWEVAYGTWRDKTKPARLDLFTGSESVGADTVAPVGDGLGFIHQNGASDRESVLAREQKVPPQSMPGLLAGRNFGGVIVARGGLKPKPAEAVAWQTWSGRARPATTVPATSHAFAITLGAAKGASTADWEKTARALLPEENRRTAEKAEEKRWHDFWERSFVFIPARAGAAEPAFQVARNYQLFRQMLACNEGGEFPLKFNGGIFTADTHPDRVPPALNNPSLSVAPSQGTTPDFRRWGQMFMSQNQRWLGWPTLASGDADLLAPSIAFYRNRAAIARARAGNLGAQGACYPEPLGIEGTVCVAPTPVGLCGAGHLTYHFSMSLEHAWMALQAHDMLNRKIDADIPWMTDVVRFFDSFYRASHKTSSGSELDKNGRLVIYPANALELVAGATDPIDEVAGLRRVTEGLLAIPSLPSADRTFLTQVQKTLPDLPVSVNDGRKVFAAAAKAGSWHNPWELPELYAAWPYRLIGVTNPPTLKMARDTWEFLPKRGDNQTRLFAKLDFSWQPTWAYTAALGLPEEAGARAIAKFSDKASACRYPAFFGPGHDWMPDHNWGGSGMVGLQEMLVAGQPGPHGKIHVLPAWPRTWDVRFRLHTAGNTTVDGEVSGGRLVRLNVEPQSRRADVIPGEGWTLP